MKQGCSATSRSVPKRIGVTHSTGSNDGARAHRRPARTRAAQTFVAVAETSLLGFYLLTPTHRADTCELDFLFVEPTAIGRGIGQALLTHACTTARGSATAR